MRIPNIVGDSDLNKVLDGSPHCSHWSSQVLDDLTLLSFFMEDNQLRHLHSGKCVYVYILFDDKGI